MGTVSAPDTFREKIEEWSEQLLRPYLERLAVCADKSCIGAKEFNDAVWTTVVLSPLEVLILDSPLLQRLRHIRQLGVVHLIYPSATHTRLEHSIGTVYQVSRLIDGINAEEQLVPEELASLLRVTALCHDVGHGVMSHVSENALQHFRDVRQLRRQFGAVVRVEQPKLSEIAAYYMVGSPAFAELLQHAQRITGDHQLPGDAQELMRKAIIGLPVAPGLPLIHELISGPFDGDKLDYMTRDARMTGVPVVTDIPRLVRKVRGRRLATATLPKEIQATVPKEHDTCVMTGVALSGCRTLDELVFGQTLLYDKLYRHQKVRAAEAMVAAIFDQIAGLTNGGALMAPYEMVDAELLHLDEARVERLAGRPLEGEDELRRARVAIDLAGRLHKRHLFRRAYAFAQNMPLDPYRADSIHRNGLVAFTRMARKPHERGEFVGEIANIARGILTLLGREDVLGDLPGGDMRPYIWLDAPNAQTQSNETVRAYLLGDGPGAQHMLPFRDEYAETPGWSNAYLLTRDTGYVFTIDELTLPVYLAVEKLVRTRFGVRSPESMLPYAKQSPAEVTKAKDTLARGGFYDDAPYDIRPLPAEFMTSDFPRRLQRVRETLERYEGPVYEAQKEKRATVMSPERIEAFVRQFGSEHADEALAMIERLRVIDRECLVQAVKAFLGKRRDEFSSAVPLGEPKDSSAITTYYAGDIAKLTIRSTGDALRRGDGIVFAEDFVGTGNQTISIFESLLGVEPTINLNEHREEPLPEELRELFRSRSLAIVFAAGARAGAKAVEAAAKRLNLKLDVYLHEAPTPMARWAKGSAFRRRCEEIGRQLLHDDDPTHDEAWTAQRTLGYGNKGFLVTFPYNTPTQTLTCLWKAGQVDGIEWVPLLPRRPKR